MSWLTGQSTDRAGLLTLRPELAASHDRLIAALWSGPISPSVLELCRLRMAMLLRCAPALAERSRAAKAHGLAEETIARLADWPTDPAFGPTDRACLTFAEVYVIDAVAAAFDAMYGTLLGAGIVGIDVKEAMRLRNAQVNDCGL